VKDKKINFLYGFTAWKNAKPCKGIKEFLIKL
jgi:hypothetical protein